MELSKMSVCRPSDFLVRRRVLFEPSCEYIALFNNQIQERGQTDRQTYVRLAAASVRASAGQRARDLNGNEATTSGNSLTDGVSRKGT